MKIKLEHVLLLLFVIILFYFANNVEGVYDHTCWSNFNSQSEWLCETNKNCVFHYNNPDETGWFDGGTCQSRDPPPCDLFTTAESCPLPRCTWANDRCDSPPPPPPNRCIQDESGSCDFNCPAAGNDCCFSSDSHQVNLGLVTEGSCNACLRSYGCE